MDGLNRAARDSDSQDLENQVHGIKEPEIVCMYRG